MARWIVGVDAGGTSTRAAAVDLDSGERREASTYGANWSVHGPDLCCRRLAGAVTEALPAGTEPAAVALCVAGYYAPDHAAAAEAWSQAIWPHAARRIETDVLGAWAGAHRGEPGIVLISGTGSICFGRNRRGETARAGGWGPLFSDLGSAYTVGVACLRAISREVDGMGPATQLTQRVRQRWPEPGSDPISWLRGIYRLQWGREQIALLTTEVAAAATEGDAVALELLREAAGQLADYVEAVARNLAEPGLPLVVQGGLGASNPQLRAGLTERLASSGIRLRDGWGPPVDGAVILAAEALNGAAGVRELCEKLG